MKKRVWSIIIIFALCVNMIQFGVVAAESGDMKMCQHHSEHTEDCGYVKGTEGEPCTHEHTEECSRMVTQCVHEHTLECYSGGGTLGEWG